MKGDISRIFSFDELKESAGKVVSVEGGFKHPKKEQTNRLSLDSYICDFSKEKRAIYIGQIAGRFGFVTTRIQNLDKNNDYEILEATRENIGFNKEKGTILILKNPFLRTLLLSDRVYINENYKDSQKRIQDICDPYFDRP